VWALRVGGEHGVGFAAASCCEPRGRTAKYIHTVQSKLQVPIPSSAYHCMPRNRVGERLPLRGDCDGDCGWLRWEMPSVTGNAASHV
jgi:hypothetical protein